MGGTGYIGRRLAAQLLARGHRVRALAREGSEARLPPGVEIARGDPFDAVSLAGTIPPSDTLVQLLGVPHPSPTKAALFRSVDLASATASGAAAAHSGVAHFVYVSVARPSPVMKAYQEARGDAEDYLRTLPFAATFLRPWYVLGPGHRWPYVLLPLYAIAERLPGARETARRLGLVTLADMVRALVRAIENPPVEGIRVLEVPDIRSGG